MIFGSAILDVAIGLFFLYLLLSLLASAIQEVLASLLDWRAKTLTQGLANLLNDEQLVAEFYAHPLIQSIHQGERKPTYIPARTFTITLLDIFSANRDDKSAEESVDELKENIKKIPNRVIRIALQLSIKYSEKSVEKMFTRIDNWFDSAMSGLSEVYKRKSQLALIIISSVIVLVANMDTISIGHALMTDSALRENLANTATEFQSQIAADPDMSEAIKADAQKTASDLLATLNSTGLQIGWWVGKDFVGPKNFGEGVLKLIGLLVTVLAMSMGAQFWFDILKSLIAIRNRGRKEKNDSALEAVTPPGTPVLEKAVVDESGSSKSDKPSKSDRE